MKKALKALKSIKYRLRKTWLFHVKYRLKSFLEKLTHFYISSLSKPKGLYWVTTKDHGEDWFIIASSNRKAEKFHKDYEGYTERDANAEKVSTVYKSYEDEKAYHGQTWMLKDLEFDIVRGVTPRIVRKNGRTYHEGTIVESVIKELSDTFEGTYIIQAVNTRKFKIGSTKNLRKRIRDLQTGNHAEIELYDYYRTPEYKRVEKFLHKEYKDNNLTREWFTFTRKELLEIHDLIHEKFIMYQF